MKSLGSIYSINSFLRLILIDAEDAKSWNGNDKKCQDWLDEVFFGDEDEEVETKYVSVSNKWGRGIIFYPDNGDGKAEVFQIASNHVCVVGDTISHLEMNRKDYPRLPKNLLETLNKLVTENKGEVLCELNLPSGKLIIAEDALNLSENDIVLRDQDSRIIDSESGALMVPVDPGKYTVRRCEIQPFWDDSKQSLVITHIQG